LAVDFLTSPPLIVVASSVIFPPVLPADDGTAYFEAAFTSLLFTLADVVAGVLETAGWDDFFVDFFPLIASFSLQEGQVNS
jgi:hypothetical protein